ncbi:hypothetical protein GGX14DRAFT_397859 [Mycena pura]|uniref:Uncharacterized protein n=1 Tax=Mycena pura TaxID=153505 RepID=A0AAD6VEK3_9AGAR|nr:hypothetical protein GGX14DRAFT_397859 [Mycena pura]
MVPRLLEMKLDIRLFFATLKPIKTKLHTDVTVVLPFKLDAPSRPASPNLLNGMLGGSRALLDRASVPQPALLLAERSTVRAERAAAERKRVIVTGRRHGVRWIASVFGGSDQIMKTRRKWTGQRSC